MATGLQNQELVPENLRKQLAAAVRSIQWSYAIFWSTSPSQPGVLKWGEGYYNGDIKTRKTIKAVELDDDLIGLQRSRQLRELYETLLAGENNGQSRRPSAALSPEDLTSTEWYYLLSMSYDYSLSLSLGLGHGLPGRAFLTERPIWLCNAQYADSKVFTRSLLAKSASIQTVLFFPFWGGVVELGVTEPVSENCSIVDSIRTSLSQIPPKGPSCSMAYHNIESIDTTLTPLVVGKVESPKESSDEFRHIQEVEEEPRNDGEVSRAQSWRFMDDQLSNGIYSSMISSDCISQTFFYPKDENRNCVHLMLELELPVGEDLHYHNVLSSLFQTPSQSHPLRLRPSIQDCKKEYSSFVFWRKQDSPEIQQPGELTPQRMLKKILFEVPRLHNRPLFEPEEAGEVEDEIWRTERDATMAYQVVVDKRRREKVNDRFSVLKTLMPSTSQADKVLILDDTIALLERLKKRVEELESRRDVSKYAGRRTKRKLQDMAERTSDNYHNNKTCWGSSKRKDIDEGMQEMIHISYTDDLCEDILITTVEEDIVVELTFPWRECLLFEIIDTLSNLHLDSYAVQSSTVDGILSVTAKSKIRGSNGVSAGMIRQALQKVLLRKCRI
ncbi:endoglucanase 3 [Dionaea muscipula]